MVDSVFSFVIVKQGRVLCVYLKGPPVNGGKPSPKTAPTSPSNGLNRMFSSSDNTASLTNLNVVKLVNINYIFWISIYHSQEQHTALIRIQVK